MLFAPHHFRRFATSRTAKFLAFEEAREWAREWARTTGKHTTRDWRGLTSEKRPANVPSRPQCVYKDEWRGLRDWLGGTPGITRYRETRGPPPEIAPLEERSGHCCAKHVDALRSFHGMLFSGGCEPLFRFFLMPKSSTITYLFQPRDTVTPNLWGAVALHAGSYKTKHGRTTFHRPPRPSQSVEICYDSIEKQWFVIEEPLNVSTVCILGSGSGSGKYDASLVDPQLFPRILNRLYDTDGDIYTKDEWLRRSCDSWRGSKTIAGVIETMSRLYDPCAVPVAFPALGSHHNLLLGGRRVLFRIGRNKSHEAASNDVSWDLTFEKAVGKTRVTYEDTDDIDFVVVLVVAGGQTKGCFFFPKQKLVERKIFSSRQEGGGVCCLTLLLPPVSRPVHTWQEEFFIDFGEGEMSPKSRRRFLEILKSY